MDRTPDRAPRQLTTHPAMVRTPPTPPDQNSIFGDTYGGVPNPNTIVAHGYPTRYHGPIWTVPQAGHRYVGQTYTRAPFLGFDDDAKRLSPSITGRPTGDAVIGAVVGYFGAPKKEQALVYAGVGALAAWLLGSVGLIGLLSFEVYQAQKKGHLRRDLPVWGD